MGLSIKILHTFIFDGDVEINPGRTHVIEKAICGSYHQGDRQFGDTADA